MVLLATGLAIYADSCPEILKDKQADIERYVEKRYSLSVEDPLTITANEVVDDTCYRKLTLESSSHTKRLTVFLSPDQRYLISTLMDLTIDPAVEAQKARARIQQVLTADSSPSKGKADAPVTIVEFSDFQCPFCRRMASLLEALPDAEKGKVRIVYKLMPLPMHSWARMAATLAACAEQQGDATFWRVHDFFFSQQASLRPESIEAAFYEFLKNGSAGIDEQQIRTCAANGNADRIIARDLALAQLLHVRATPTLFVNGERAVGIRTAEDLVKVIEKFSGVSKQSALSSSIQNTANMPDKKSQCENTATSSQPSCARVTAIHKP
jgi:protein-disulfide isomerase